MKQWLATALSIFALIASVLIVYSAAMTYMRFPSDPDKIKGMEHCGGQLLRNDMTTQERFQFNQCLRARAQTFYERDYAEAKDLAKTFLTLLSAILVASITFSEKIVDIANARLRSLYSMILCWILLLFAMIVCGTGLLLMSSAAAIAAYAPAFDYRIQEERAIMAFFIAGGAFVGALVALIVAGITSLTSKLKNRHARDEPNSITRL